MDSREKVALIRLNVPPRSIQQEFCFEDIEEIDG